MTEKLAIAGGTPVLGLEDHVQWPPIGEEERAAVLRVLDRGTLSGSDAPEMRAFEDEFAAAVGAKYALMTHAGTSALLLGMAAAGLRPGDEVIFPAFGFIASPLAALHLGAIPRFADVRPMTGNLCPKALEKAITPRTRAIMPVHIHGCPADMDEILAVAKAHKLRVIEDAAQAHLAEYKGRKVGALADGGGFSLQSTKNLSTGEGGVYVTNDLDAIEAANCARNFGQNVSAPGVRPWDAKRPHDGEKGLRVHRYGAMYRGNELAAAFGRAQLRKLPAWTEQAQVHAERLNAALAELPGITPTDVGDDRKSVWHKYRVHIDPVAAGVDLAPRVLRDVLIETLNAEGANALLWGDIPMSVHPFFLEAKETYPVRVDDWDELLGSYQPENFPVTHRFLDSSLLLFSQTYPLIAQPTAVVDKYIDAFRKVWEHRSQLPDLAHRSRD